MRTCPLKDIVINCPQVLTCLHRTIHLSTFDSRWWLIQRPTTGQHAENMMRQRAWSKRDNYPLPGKGPLLYHSGTVREHWEKDCKRWRQWHLQWNSICRARQSVAHGNWQQLGLLDLHEIKAEKFHNGWKKGSWIHIHFWGPIDTWLEESFFFFFREVAFERDPCSSRWSYMHAHEGNMKGH